MTPSPDSILRRIIPRRMVSAWRLVSIFQGGHGHLKQSDGFPVDRNGDYQPWWTYPLIEYLRGLDFTGKRVFEYGAGASTLFWSRRATEVVAVEMDERWCAKLRTLVPANVTLLQEPDSSKYPAAIERIQGPFDVIVVDGAERYRSAEAALPQLAVGGFIILDNADWYPRTADLLQGGGLIEVRFSGITPLNAFTSTTSVFLSRNFSFDLSRPARQIPVGGVSLEGGALDDGPRSS